ncbi:SKI2 subunit of superkiller complex protein-like [Paramacrobiotus metropolitanus]|uniref:SKI2 subunit of superkiller complex protein-like n=1 Tax=Paramacrobiotus metropolitanus TaxID=2943436 RepID=UPI002445AC66|nr:SKI2 subunit of superkiller complex protein-like [Paramacrobiotus metropolitanus]
MDAELERTLRLAVAHRQFSDSLDAEFSPDPPALQLPYLGQSRIPDISLLQLRQHVPAASSSDTEEVLRIRQHIQQMDATTLARLEARLQPEEIMREYLTLPQLQQATVLEDEPPDVHHAWSYPPLDFEMVLERDPFNRNPAAWREIDTNGMEMNSRNSADFRREPTQPGENYLFGSVTQMPFVPGGMESAFSEIDRFALPSQEMLEEGREYLKNFDKLPQCPPEFADNEEFFFNASESAFAKLPFINGLNDLLSEKELDLLKKWQAVQPVTGANKVADERLWKDMRSLLELAGYGEIYSELFADDELDGLDGSHSALRISSATDLKNIKSWAVKVDVGIPIPDFAAKMPNMAHKYPFELDIFQKQAVLHLENHDSVFVAAHTSAGKTVVAEYAIALSLRAKTRCVYTSPIKALSNQKYRDFKSTFHDVGLLTGDVQIEPNSHCLVMTTEILRSMLYRGSEIVRDLDWVIFDEVHYVNDAERGVVWEEILIMLPAQVGIVMLSATVPNAMEFADWIGRIKQRKIYVISTTKRPVPLEHHLFVCVGSKTIDKDLVIVSTRGEMLTKNHSEAVGIQKEYEKKNNIKMGLSLSERLPPKQDKTVWLAFMDFVQQKELMPVIAFVFSRNRCDQLGDMLSSLDLTSQSEKHTIVTFFRKATSRLNESDRKLPQILRLEYYLERGVGVHHSGILPIMKEAVEMLFQQGLVKILLATETFAMGVNMPARSVVFDSIRKHDGTEFRDLHPGEYIQMSGRAGRRGLDKTGTVYILCKMARIPDSSKLNHMILGVPMKLHSQFRLTYGMILQLLRIGTISIMDVMKRSFSEHSNASRNPEQEEQLAQLIGQANQMVELECAVCKADIGNYCRTFDNCRALRKKLNTVLLSPDNRLLAPGRVVTTNADIHRPPSAGIIVSAPSRTPQSERYFRVLEFSGLEVGSVVADVRRLACGEIHQVMNATVKAETERIMSEAEAAKTSNKAKKSFQEVIEKVASQISGLKKLEPLSPNKDFKLTDMQFIEQWEEMLALESTLNYFDCRKCPDFYKHVEQEKHRLDIVDQIAQLRHLLSNDSLRFLPEYQQRLDVLHRLQYVLPDLSITVRGRVACEISTTEHDLLMAECVFHNIFTDRQPAEIVALLSGLVFQGKVDAEIVLPPGLSDGVEAMRSVALEIGQAQREAGMKEAVSYVADAMNFGLAEVVWQWCLGMPFVEITGLTEVQEGIIVRTMTRLDEVCRDVKAAAKVTGNSRLMSKMEEAQKALKRDIAFVGSLYTTD